jgi:hypothetical protein
MFTLTYEREGICVEINGTLQYEDIQYDSIRQQISIGG